MRILLYTGKGGVGKTSVSAATAVRCAEFGYRTIIVSTDPAHSLADSFDMPLGAEPVQIAERLWGQEVDILHQMDRYWGKVQEYLTALLAWRGMENLMAEETSILPGMEELASLMQITHLHDSGDYDVIIVDCAPTGATLQLLSFPELARWYIEKIFPWERRAMRAAAPLLRRVANMPLPDDEFYGAVESLVIELNRMADLLRDSQRTSIRLVLNPEKMVVREAQRSFTYLNLYGYAIDAIICNRMLPEQVADQYFTTWKEAQSRHRQLVEEAFSPLPILDVPLFDQEVVGIDMLRQMAGALYAERDPTEVFFKSTAQEVTATDGSYRLSLPLPFVEREDIELHRSIADELVIRIGNWKRHVILPRALVDEEITAARYAGDRLHIYFGNAAQEAPQQPATWTSANGNRRWNLFKRAKSDAESES